MSVRETIICTALVPSAVFQIAVSGNAGKTRATNTDKLGGSAVFPHVWPTSIECQLHDPLLCVADVFKVDSGKFNLPGKVNQ